MKQTRLNIVTKTDNYPIIIGSNLTLRLSKIFKLNSIDFNKCLIVIDNKRTLKGTITDGNIRRGLLRGCRLTDHVAKISNKKKNNFS